MRVMLDTNILVSAVVFYNREIHNMVSKIVADHELILASYVIDELIDVIGRKFPEQLDKVTEFLAELSYTHVDTPKYITPGLFDIRDAFDYPIVYSAIVFDVDVLITGDKDIHAVEIEKPKVMTIAEFASVY